MTFASARSARVRRTPQGAFATRKASLHTETLRTVAFAPDEATSDVSSTGKPYVKARGTLTWRNQDLTRTLMFFDDMAADVASPILEGATVVMEGRFKRVRHADGSLGGEFFVASRLMNVLDAEGRPVLGDGTGREIRGHHRVGYYRRQRHGPANSLVKRIWVEATEVNGGVRQAA